MKKTLGRNKHQKAAHKPGEKRVGREEVSELLEMSRSSDPAERWTAAKFLCPCHVRRRVEPVWEALYRMLEDPDVRVRRAAWHTLEDGGRPDDPALDAVLKRVLENETDVQVLTYARKVTGPRNDQELARMRMAGNAAPKERGRCDFCGADGVPVERDYQTIIPSNSLPRPARICEPCSRS